MNWATGDSGKFQTCDLQGIVYGDYGCGGRVQRDIRTTIASFTKAKGSSRPSRRAAKAILLKSVKSTNIDDR
jgi:hypothetical protein